MGDLERSARRLRRPEDLLPQNIRDPLRIDLIDNIDRGVDAAQDALSGDAQKIPYKPTEPKPMPLPEDEQARLAKRRKQLELSRRRGRQSTILTAFSRDRLGAMDRGLG